MADREAGKWGGVIMVVGMQFGSEGKGAITEYLAPIIVGSLINLDVLFREIKFISKFFDLEGRLFIDRNAHVITDEQIEAEQKTDLASRIGSTSATAGEGIGMAMADKILRK